MRAPDQDSWLAEATRPTAIVALADVCFEAHYGPKSDIAPCPKSARSRLMHRSREKAYSITSSACASSVGGTVRSSAFAAFKLIASLNLVGSCTGRSEGDAP